MNFYLFCLHYSAVTHFGNRKSQTKFLKYTFGWAYIIYKNYFQKIFYKKPEKSKRVMKS